jgi:hypothetical protein
METLFDRAAKTSRTQVAKMRWALGLHGLASAAVGVMILAWPGIGVFARSRSSSAPTRSQRASSSSVPRSPLGTRRSAGG